MQHLLHVYYKNIHGDVNLICLSITSVCWYAHTKVPLHVGTSSSQTGGLTIICPDFCWKLHKNEWNWAAWIRNDVWHIWLLADCVHAIFFKMDGRLLPRSVDSVDLNE